MDLFQTQHALALAIIQIKKPLQPRQPRVYIYIQVLYSKNLPYFFVTHKISRKSSIQNIQTFLHILIYSAMDLEEILILAKILT